MYSSIPTVTIPPPGIPPGFVIFGWCLVLHTRNRPMSACMVGGWYTCQLSRLGRESHACESKTSISRSITPTDQFLTPLLESMSSCSHIWQTPRKYVICKRVICTQSNNGLKSAHKWQFFRGKFSDFRKRRDCAWQIIPWDRVPKMIGGLRKRSDSLRKFSEGFREFSVFTISWWKSHAFASEKVGRYRMVSLWDGLLLDWRALGTSYTNEMNLTKQETV